MPNCCNFIVCNNTCDNITCIDCIMLFGKWRGRQEVLNTKDYENCNICNNIGISVTRPDCEHFLCIECFKKVYIEPYITRIDNSVTLNKTLEYNFNIKKCEKCIIYQDFLGSDT